MDAKVSGDIVDPLISISLGLAGGCWFVFEHFQCSAPIAPLWTGTGIMLGRSPVLLLACLSAPQRSLHAVEIAVARPAAPIKDAPPPARSSMHT